jgi:isoleucyl-tRNA synthetase
MSEKVDFKPTLNLPETAFPMRGNLPQTEPETIKRWTQAGLYQKIIQKNLKNKKFVMPDGPPYANGKIHLGHSLNKILKDIVIKYKGMSGYRAEFIPGWDCHGLPIELKVTKDLGAKKKDLTDQKIRELCRAEANKWIDIQREQFIRLGILADWQNPYKTLDPAYEAEEIRVLAKILENGILYRGLKPVYWCPALQTALAAAEIEYKNHRSPSIYVRFYLSGSLSGPHLSAQTKANARKLDGKKTSIVIWTTTPWTLPANQALCVHPDFEYGFYEVEGKSEVVLIATELKEKVEKACSKTLNLLFTLKGSELEGVQTDHPFMGTKSPVVLGKHVTLETGTGVVHTAPGHGLEDYQVGLDYKLKVMSPVTPDGRFTDEVPKYVGVSIWEGNKKIVSDLEDSGHLMGYHEIEHSYPHNPRSKTPLIFRATPQWFIRMDDDEFGLRKRALNAIDEQIKFIPDWGKARLQSMVENTPDWCLSRQRIWGVPIPVFYCDKCEEPLATPKLFNRIADLMESTKKGMDAYHELTVEELVGEHGTCAKCNNKTFTKSKDILDVWFDSGICHTAVQSKREGLEFQADIYLEGSDQHRGWFQTSLMSSMAAYKKPPYKALITHGFILDAQGLKMSKSGGNSVDPEEVIKKYGSEILRLWVAYEDYGQDVSVGEELFNRVTDTYRRIRNTMRFLLGNLGDFDPAKDSVAIDKMTLLDQWALHEFNELTKKVNAGYENFDFYKVYHALNDFFTVTLSAMYLDILKDRLYTWKKAGVERRSSQTVFYLMLKDLLPMMAPILSFLAEETYSYLPGKKQESVFLENFPKPNADYAMSEAQANNLSLIFDLREKTNKKMEDLRKEKTIGANLDAAVSWTLTSKNFAALRSLQDLVKEILIVSQFTLLEGSAEEIKIAKASGEKCPRCWHYNENLTGTSAHAGVCPKCVKALT